MKRIITLVLTASMLLAGCSLDKKVSGTYSGTGIGRAGEIVVDLTLTDSKITDIKIVKEQESDGLDDAMDLMAEEIIAENSLDVDSISGATLSSAGFRMAVTDAFGKTGLKAEDLKAGQGLTAEARDKEYTADVIVIGAGGAGMTAGVSAAEHGATAIVLEKMPLPGGNTLISGGEMAAPGNWVQETEQIDDSADLFYEDIVKGGDGEGDPALIRVLADGALDGARWLQEEIGMVFEDYMLFFGGHTVMRSLVPKDATGYEMISRLVAKLEEKSIPLHLETAATELIKDETGRVTGVKARYNDQEIVYLATKGVILATGGFGYNVAMREKYNAEMNKDILSTNAVGSTGDGLVMAETAGAQLLDMEYIQTYPTCDTQSGALLYVGDVRLAGRSILVNKEGKRFVEELERRDVISRAVIAQTEGVSYMVWDEASMLASEVGKKHEAEYNGLIAREQLVKADTLEEAAAFFGIDAAQLKTTVDNYNKYARDGKDLEFNKRGTLTAFGEGPYYIMKSKPAVHHTMGGVRIDPSTHVLTAEGDLIPGLYAAGEVVGDIHGTNRLGSDAIADITVFGRIAGETAAAGK